LKIQIKIYKFIKMTHNFKNLNIKGADVWYHEHFFSPNDQQIWYEMIDNEVNWQQFTIMMYGKLIKQPRDSFYMADNGYPYKYSGVDRKPEDWSVSVNEMKKILDIEIRELFPHHVNLNACLGNRYINGTQNIGSHSDDEKDISPNSFIVSVSLGTTRDFIFTHKETKEKITIKLNPGSVLLMGGDCQKNWKHELPKRLRVKEPRINLTFRTITQRS
jgi:alkylated DNA repair dioxygenase AlkB